MQNGWWKDSLTNYSYLHINYYIYTKTVLFFSLHSSVLFANVSYFILPFTFTNLSIMIQQSESDMFMASLICNMDVDCEKLLICKMDMDCVKALHFDTEVI